MKLAPGGEQFLHGWVDFRFASEKQRVDGGEEESDDEKNEGIRRREEEVRKRCLELHARARAFSSYLLMIGTLPAADAFEPK